MYKCGETQHSVHMLPSGLWRDAHQVSGSDFGKGCDDCRAHRFPETPSVILQSGLSSPSNGKVSPFRNTDALVW